jgi:site-specific DNA recombinase
MSETTKRAAIYVRVSTDEQVDKFSIPSQIRALKELAAKRGYEIPPACEFIDDGYSGENTNRPALTQLRAAVRARAVDIVLAYEPDRLARRLSVQCVVADEIEAAGVALEFCSGEKATDPNSRLFFQMKGAFAEYEREKIRERTTRGRIEMARLGMRPSGRPPFGYALDKAGRRLVVNEAEATVVRRIYDWVAAGNSVRWVMLELGRRGVKTRKGARWAISSVDYVLRLRSYMGEGVFNKRIESKQADGSRKDGVRPESEWITFSVPPIITPESFARVQDQLARNREVCIGRRATTHVYLLRGLLRCGICGARYSGMGTKGRMTYRCNNNQGGNRSCTVPQLHADHVEGQVWDTIVNIIRHPEALRESMDRKEARQGAREAEVRSAVEHVKRQLADVQRRERRLLDLYMAEDRAAPEAVRTKMDDLAQERRLLEGRLREAEAVAAKEGAQEQQYAAVAQWCAQVGSRVDQLERNGDRAGKQRLLQAVIGKVVVKGQVLEVENYFRDAPRVEVAAPQPQRAECEEMFSSGSRASTCGGGRPTA